MAKVKANYNHKAHNFATSVSFGAASMHDGDLREKALS